MRILHVINSLNPLVGGPRENVASIGGYLASVGHTVEVASCSDTPDCEWLPRYPIPVHPLGPAFLRYSYSPKLVPWLRKNIQRFDVVIINGLWQYQGLGSYRVLRQHQHPYFVYTHGMLDPWSRRTYPGKYLKKFLYWTAFEYYLLRNASGVFFTSDEESRLARHYFPRWRWKEVIVGAGIAAPPSAEDGQQELLKVFPALRNKRIVLFLGRIHEKKGVDLLIRAFSRVELLDPAIHLLIAGTGDQDYIYHLKNLAKELGIEGRITWAGMVQGDLKWGMFRIADLFALPSHQENFGIAAVEALACKTPVLVSNKVNIWSDIQQDGAGLICDDSLESVADSMKRWIACGNAEMSQMGLRALSCFQARYQVSVAARKVESAIKSAMR